MSARSPRTRSSDAARAGSARLASLAHLTARLERRSAFVTLAHLERAAGRRPTGVLPPEAVASAVDAAVADLLLLTDRRTFFDRASGAFREEQIYRVNRRHPFVRDAP